jgi:hypothetical protein
MFFVAHHFLWAYPKNLKLLAAAFGMSKNMGEGEKLWRWIRMIAGLKRIKIVLPEEQYNNPRSQIFIISVNGTYFRVWEKKHVLKDKRERAVRKFQLAIDQAGEQGAINEQALACKRAGMALEGWGETKKSLAYYKKARILYERWGSTLKFDQLTNLISGLKKPECHPLSGCTYTFSGHRGSLSCLSTKEYPPSTLPNERL